VRALLSTSSGGTEELTGEEGELVDRYLDDEMTGAEREGFERELLRDPALAEQVRFGRLLRMYVERSSCRP
jgi:hypothetical protein